MSIDSNDILKSTKIAMEYLQHIRFAIDKLKSGDKATSLLIAQYIEKSIRCDLELSDVSNNIRICEATIH